MDYLIVKSLHIVLVVSWFAGLFYLPRLFVNHAMVEDAATKERLALMERKLFRFMTGIAVMASICGLWLWLVIGIGGGWMHVKLVLVLFLVAYHYYCGILMRKLAEGKNTHSHVWFRCFNEIPVLVLLAVTFLVVLKPF